MLVLFVLRCAFGMLVRRWGIFWRPLEMKFQRRAQVIGACMRLHSYCINKKIILQLEEVGDHTEYQPDRWALTPMFDKHNNPVAYMQPSLTPLTTDITDDSALASSSDRDLTRKRLIEAIDDASLIRPLAGSKRRREKFEGII